MTCHHHHNRIGQRAKLKSAVEGDVILTSARMDGAFVDVRPPNLFACLPVKFGDNRHNQTFSRHPAFLAESLPQRHQKGA